MKRFGGIALVAIAVITTSCHRKPTTEADGGVGVVDASASAVLDASVPLSVDAGSTEGDAGVVAAAPTNEDGWPRVDVFPACAIYRASDDAQSAPAPFAWEPCDASALAGDAGATPSCRQLVGGIKSASLVDADAKAGRVTFETTRVLKPPYHVLHVIGDADGPVRQALASDYASPSHCELRELAASSTRAVYRVGNTTFGPAASQLVVVPLDGTVPSVLHVPSGLSFVAPAKSMYYASNDTDIVALAWSDGHVIEKLGGPVESVAASAVDDLLVLQSRPVGFGSVAADTQEGSLTRFFRAGAKSTDLVTFDPDKSEGQFENGFATDGTDMVWAEGVGRPEPDNDPQHWDVMWDGPWKHVELMTAPFTTDRTKLAKRSIGSWLKHSLEGAVVGCGYAGVKVFTEGMRVVRLSDGRTWKLSAAKVKPRTQFTSIMAVTCNEVFATMRNGDAYTVARIRLDSLGPGEPAK